MPRADLIVDLVRAWRKSDRPLFQRAAEALVAEERANQHHVLATRLEEILRADGQPSSEPLANLDSVAVVSPEKRLDDLVLAAPLRRVCEELIEEQRRTEVLRSHNIEPRHRVLLVGPPGNGKTSLAEALASALLVPLVRVRYDAVIGSFLGETASRLRRVFDFARTRHCILFFDEFDTLAKERGDIHETGEIKRVVSSLLLGVDELPSHVVVVAATNHPELLDRAVWRRFEIRLDLPMPNKAMREQWFRAYVDRVELKLGVSAEYLATRTSGASFGDLEMVGAEMVRKWLLSSSEVPPRRLVADALNAWHGRNRVTKL